jgi:hypothetical protein
MATPTRRKKKTGRTVRQAVTRPNIVIVPAGPWRPLNMPNMRRLVPAPAPAEPQPLVFRIL